MAYKNNSIKLTGNLTTDVNLKTVQVGGSDRSCATFGLAVHTNDNRTDFFRVTSWGNQADRDAKYLKKGSFVAISGDVATGFFEKDGVKMPSFNINADEVVYLQKKSDNVTSKESQPKQKENVAE